jgi:hypothetical protein
LPAGYANANAVAYGESGWAGNIIPSGNAVYSLGNATNQWNDLYVSNTTIYMNNVPVSLSAGNVLTVNGNAVLQNNSNSTISTTGNITANYLFGDGSQLTGISTANIGNVTFDDVNIIGTGNLNLQPNDASSEYLNIYLTGAADIHVAYGGGSGNVILGTDEQANVAVLLDGNVAIQAGNVAGTKTWTFDTAGNLTLPMGGVVYETNIPDGALSGSAIALTPPGGTNADQQLLIYPTVNDANHLHLTTGNLYNTELFLGNDNLYVKLSNTGNVVINSNDDVGNTAQWTFGTDGNLTTSSNLVIGPSGLGTGTSFTQLDAPLLLGSSEANGKMSLVWYENPTGPGNVVQVGLNDSTPGSMTVTTGDFADTTYVWNFDNVGNLTLPTGGNIYYANGAVYGGSGSSYGNANVADFLDSLGSNAIVTTGNITGGNLISSTGIVGNIELIMGNVANASATRTRILSDGAFSYIQTGNGTASTTGNIVFSPYQSPTQRVVIDTASGNLSAVGNITAQNFTGNISITGNVQGTSANVTLVAGSYSTVFDNTGNLTLPGNTFAVNYANNTPVDVVTRFESTWTVPVGNSTQSFTVGLNETYYMWVDCNIPNGILTWNATATVTNNNVPVVGAQYAWVYDGGGTPIDFTSIPNQFVGTANTIVRGNVAPSATTNRFDFGINNTSGNAVTVRYGWIQIS